MNLVNGSKEAVDGILTHPAIRAISFVGSTAVAKYIYSQGAITRETGAGSGWGKEPGCNSAGCGYGCCG